ncbi:HTH_ARSR domain containing protein [uncultured Caudovirales phage]|uniref:HTH_ARSR domain containing protein n=1 Tax=uncultured Caudovirales phage TaxID=2100421 RepID=A0A6J7WJE2_9CAUD|nr:HTH_ARSR domain containing protein [uncultured Caudovirales phage]
MKLSKNEFYVVSVEDTINYGIVSAAIIGRVRWWCEYNQKNKVKDRQHNNEWWSGFMSSIVLSEQLGISKKTIETHLSKLLKDGVLIKGVFNKKGYDRTSWYRVNPFPPIKEKVSSNQVIPFTQIKEMDIPKSGTPIPVSISVIKNVKTSVKPPVNPELLVEEQIEELNKLISEDKFETDDARGEAYMLRTKLTKTIKI